MTDSRIAEAQKLHWEIELLERLGVSTCPQLNAKHREIAEIYEDRARELLGRGDPDGWPDLLAAITHLGRAGEPDRGLALIDFGKASVSMFGAQAGGLTVELESLRRWLPRQFPSLAAFARPLPPLDDLAA